MSNIVTFSIVSVLTQLHNTFTQNNGLETPSINIQNSKNKENIVFRDGKDLKGLSGKVQDSRF